MWRLTKTGQQWSKNTSYFVDARLVDADNSLVTLEEVIKVVRQEILRLKWLDKVISNNEEFYNWDNTLHLHEFQHPFSFVMLDWFELKTFPTLFMDSHDFHQPTAAITHPPTILCIMFFLSFLSEQVYITL